MEDGATQATKTRRIYVIHDINYDTYYADGIQVGTDGKNAPRWTVEKGDAKTFMSLEQAQAALIKLLRIKNQDNEYAMCEEWVNYPETRAPKDACYVVHDIKYDTYYCTGTQNGRNGAKVPRWTYSEHEARHFASLEDAEAAMEVLKTIDNQDNEYLVCHRDPSRCPSDTLYLIHDVAYDTYYAPGRQNGRDGAPAPRWVASIDDARSFVSLEEAEAVKEVLGSIDNQDNNALECEPTPRSSSETTDVFPF